MAKEELILAIDIGATSIKLCEFAVGGDGTLTLKRFAHREYEEELSDSSRMGVVAGLLRQMLAEGGFQGRRALLGMSGQYSLMRFSHIPGLKYDKKRVRQLAEFEATQNVPFPLDQVIMDYQLIPSPTGDGMESMSVVIRNDIAEQFSTAIMEVGLQPLLIDVAAAASYNAARVNGLGQDGCALLLNIGGRVTNLIFIEGDMFFARTIPIAGYTITQQIAKEFNIGLPEAEELKRHHGYVALGGAYDEGNSETAASVSKIIRNVMSRLYGEITRTVSAYRSQQKGSAPTKLYITGGSSIFTYCDTFFNEKLKIPVEYFNPFVCCKVSPDVDREKLAEVGHMFSEAIGLGLRYAMQCPVELSLIPGFIRRQQDFDKKKPYMILGFIALILMLLVVWFGIEISGTNYNAYCATLSKLRIPNERIIKAIESAEGDASKCKDEMNAISALLMQQAKWPAILNEIYRIKPDNLWITSLKPIKGAVKAVEVKSMANVTSTDDPMMGSMGGGFMGDDMMGGMGGNSEPGSSTVTLGGLELEGCYVMPEKGKRATFTLGRLGELPFQVDKPLGGQESAEGGAAEEEGEEGKKKAKKDKYELANEVMKKAMEETGSTPEQAFLAALRGSRLFDADEKMTAITQLGLTNGNMATFKIQVKFSFPLDYQQASVSKGTEKK